MNDYPRMLFNPTTREWRKVHSEQEETALYPEWKRKQYTGVIPADVTEVVTDLSGAVKGLVRKGRKWLRSSTS